MGQQIRIQAGKNCSKKGEKTNFMFEEFSVGLEVSPEALMSFVDV
jgi:hypothetical protein